MSAAPARLRRFLRPTWEERKRLLRIEAWTLIILSYVLLGLSYGLPPRFPSPSPTYAALAWTAMIVRMLQYHLGLALLVVAVVAVCCRQWRLTAAAVLPMLVTVAPPWWPGSQPPAAAPTFRVMSVNLLMINRNTHDIPAEIRAADPDLLLLQEYTDHWHRALWPELSKTHPHAAVHAQEDSFGMAIFSRLPFTGAVNRWLPMGEWTVAQMRALVRAHGRDVAVYNVHLLPLRRLDYVIEHRKEFLDLQALLAREAGPTLVGGDFNFTETCPQAWALRRAGFRDAHDLAGAGRGATWPVNGPLRYLPGIRLDHIYLSPGLTATSCRTGVGEGSDHRPIVADIAFEATTR